MHSPVLSVRIEQHAEATPFLGISASHQCFIPKEQHYLKIQIGGLGREQLLLLLLQLPFPYSFPHEKKYIAKSKPNCNTFCFSKSQTCSSNKEYNLENCA